MWWSFFSWNNKTENKTISLFHKQTIKQTKAHRSKMKRFNPLALLMILGSSLADVNITSSINVTQTEVVVNSGNDTLTVTSNIDTSANETELIVTSNLDTSANETESIEVDITESPSLSPKVDNDVTESPSLSPKVDNDVTESPSLRSKVDNSATDPIEESTPEANSSESGEEIIIDDNDNGDGDGDGDGIAPRGHGSLFSHIAVLSVGAMIGIGIMREARKRKRQKMMEKIKTMKQSSNGHLDELYMDSDFL